MRRRRSGEAATPGVVSEQGRSLIAVKGAGVTTEPREQPIDRILVQRSRFLRFLQGRIAEPATAEDILQSAYVRALEHDEELLDDESVVAWFYRILRNAVIDHYRRTAARNRAHEGFVAEAATAYEPQLEATACACIGDVVRGLKDEYRSAIERIDLGSASIEDFARSEQISSNNAYVRLHRARKAVARRLTDVCGACAEHKCLDCTCHRNQV